jgi:hypothetical protein
MTIAAPFRALRASVVALTAAFSLIAIQIFASAPASAACDFGSFWSGGCNKQIEKALTPPPPSTWFPPPKEPNCGALNQAPCTVVQRIPSCKDGLTESIAQNKCVKTPPGTLPFFNTLNEMGDLAAKLGPKAQELCLRDGNAAAARVRLNPLFVSNKMFDTLNPQVLEYVAVGFGCAAPRLLDSLAALRDIDPMFWRNFEAAFNAKFSSKPCADAPDPGARITCAVGNMLFQDMFSESVCMMKSLKEIPDLFGAGGKQKSIEAYNRLGEGIFILLQWTLEQYALTKLAAPFKAKFKKEAIKRKRASNVRKGKMEDMRQYEHKVDRVLEIVKYVTLGNAIVVGLRSKMSRIPECTGATGQGITIDLAVQDAWRNIPKGSGAVVKPETLFMVNDKGHLLRFVHDAHGRFTVAGQVVSTQNWNTIKFMGAASLPNGGTALYSVLNNGDLYYYTLDGNGKFVNWGTKIGGGWGGFKRFLVARFGVLYVVDGKGDLIIYRHDKALKFGPAKVIGNGWAFKHLNSAGNGELYGVNDFGDLLFYRHDTSHRFVDGSGATIGVGWGKPGKFGLVVAQH